MLYDKEATDIKTKDINSVWDYVQGKKFTPITIIKEKLEIPAVL